MIKKIINRITKQSPCALDLTWWMRHPEYRYEQNEKSKYCKQTSSLNSMNQYQHTAVALEIIRHQSSRL